MARLGLQLAAQVMTFLLGGYETTANAMAFLIYYLSTHPDAQRRLQEEVDTVLKGQAPTLDDIPKVGRGACTGGLTASPKSRVAAAISAPGHRPHPQAWTGYKFVYLLTRGVPDCW